MLTKYVDLYLYDCDLHSVIALAYTLNIFAGVRIWAVAENTLGMGYNYNRWLFYSAAVNGVWANGVLCLM